jgi:hypothetical protein
MPTTDLPSARLLATPPPNSGLENLKHGWVPLWVREDGAPESGNAALAGLDPTGLAACMSLRGVFRSPPIPTRLSPEREVSILTPLF